MGYCQRFVAIAKIGDEYRVLAIVDHKSIYGRTSLRQTLQILKIVSAPANAPGFRREFLQIAQAASDASSKPMPRSAHPFTSTALITGSSYHEEGHYAAHVEEMPPDTPLNMLPNEEGLVIFDITTPSQPRYAYVWLGEGISKAQYASRHSAMTVMDASTYISAYYDEEERDENGSAEIVEQLKAFTVIDAALLNKLLPDADLKNKTDDSATLSGLRTLSLDTSVRDTVDLCMNGQLFELPSPAELMAAREHIMSTFVAKPRLIHANRAKQVFISLCGCLSEIDLTPFKSLDPDKIIEIINATAAAQQENKKLTLWLPTHHELELSHFQAIVNTGVISALHVGETHQRVDVNDLLKSFLKDSPLDEFTHVDLFRRAALMTKVPDTESSKWQWNIERNFPCGEGTRFPLEEIIYLTSTTSADTPRLDSGGIRWSERAGEAHFAALALQDALLSFPAMPKLSCEALTRLATAQEWQLEGIPYSKIGAGIAKALAMRDDHRIRPLPGVLEALSLGPLRAPNLPPHMCKMSPSFTKCALLAVHERPSTPDGAATMRFAFLTNNALGKPIDYPGKYIVRSPQEFFSQFAESQEELDTLKRSWQAALTQLRVNMITLHRAPEVHAVLEAEIAAGDDALDPHTCRQVAFGDCATEEVVEAMKAVEIMSKPVSPGPKYEGVPTVEGMDGPAWWQSRLRAGV